MLAAKMLLRDIFKKRIEWCGESYPKVKKEAKNALGMLGGFVQMRLFEWDCSSKKKALFYQKNKSIKSNR